MKQNKINEKNILFVNLQIIVTIASLISFIMYLFNKKMFIIMCICLIINLFILAFNNYKIFRKKNFTIIYLVSGVLLALYLIISMVG